MNRIFFNLIFLILLTHNGFGQDGDGSLPAKGDSLTSSRRMHENKAIGLSGFTSDTLSWSRFTNSNQITLKGKGRTEEITFYRLSIFYLNDDIQEYTQWNDYLSDYIIREIIATGVKKIMISDVILTRGKEDRNVGYRWFYFN